MTGPGCGAPDGPVTCVRCGSTSAVAPLTWVQSTEGDRPRWCCDRCAREHLRAIEGRLDEQWW